jgi:hypothetical protein
MFGSPRNEVTLFRRAPSISRERDSLVRVSFCRECARAAYAHVVIALDCQDVGTALASLAAVLAVDIDDLRTSLLAYDESRFVNSSEDPYVRLPRELLEGLGADAETVGFDSAFYFHGTRATDPEAFYRDGILPLDEVIERLWAELFELVRDERSAEEWEAFRRDVERDAGGHDGFLYRLKTGDRLHFGPYGVLVRDILLDPSATNSHDYLACPEIVQDIARCYQSAHKVDLEARFCAASHPVIVKFQSRDVWAGALPTSVWFVFAKLRHAELTLHARGGFDGEGRAVQPGDVVEVETLER